MPKSTQQPQKATPSRSPLVQRDEQENIAAKPQTPAVNPQHITPAQVPYLQRVMGNQAVIQLLRNQGSNQVQRAPQADIQRNFPHGATATPKLVQEEQLASKGAGKLQRSPDETIQRFNEEELEEESED
jgi:hypothetical protein